MYHHGPHSGRECGGSVRTDEAGEFTALGLVPGLKYVFTAIRDPARVRGRALGRWVSLTRITPDDPEEIELGDFKVALVGRGPPTARRRPVRVAFGRLPTTFPHAKIYDTETDGNEQIAAALKTAKAEEKHVLLQFGVNGNISCLRLNGCLRENADVAAALREHYVVVLIDVEQVGDKQHNSDVVEHYRNPTQHGLPVLVVLDADGEVLKTKDSDELVRDDEFDPAKVLQFLNRWKPK